MSDEIAKLAVSYFDAVVDSRNETLSAEDLADVLERLAWRADVSAGVGELADHWFFSDDPFRVNVVLSYEELLVNLPVDRTMDRLAEIETLWPELKPKCVRYRSVVERLAD